ncbi:MAG: putative lipid II flippase FtsW [Bacteroidales bacterium]
MARKLKSDRWLFLATLALICVSVVMVASASMPVAMRQHKPAYFFLQKQAMWAAMGLALLALAMRFDYRHYKQPAVVWTMIGMAVVALILVLFFGPVVKGGRRWLYIGNLGLQPSEFAKLAMVLFTAALLEKRMDRINDLRYSMPPIVIVLGAIVGLILLEKDLGNPIAIVAVAGATIFAAGLAVRYVVVAGAALAPLGALFVIIEPYRAARLFAFLDQSKDSQGINWQLTQSKIAVGSGGVTGRGISEGFQKLYYLPEPHNDFIYAVIAEETGLLGATAILVCFAVIAWRGLRVAGRAPDAFGALLATGLTAMIAIQAFVNMSVVLGLMPTKGIPLPLVSAGGSSLLITLLAVGILLNISQHASAEE